MISKTDSKWNKRAIVLGFSRHSRRGERGVVLIVVLALVLLLTGLTVAYLSRTMLERVSSNTSFNQAKSDELARSALDIITGDLKQEIANGSSIVAPAYPTSGTASYSPIYEATNNAYMIPTQNWPGQPTGGAASTIPNLIRTSTTSTITFPGIDHQASAVSSTTPSANGRLVTTTRWNQHYLIPCVNSATSSTPINSFTAPSWVYVTTSGAQVMNTPTTISGGAKTTVIGRYAYAVYNEGGLLDVNSAGYPSPSTQAQYGGKGSSLGYADLTQLTDSSGNELLTTSQIDQIVGWRNYASIQPGGGSFPNFVMNTDNAASYLTFLTSATNSFLKVSGAIYNSKTDQAFLSRQELLNLRSSIGFSANALQYLGTFSREINAPTFYYPAPGTATFTDLTGPNTTNSSPANDPVANTTNLNILSLRMAAAGKRGDDNGAIFTWNAGDPLVSRRFSLRRLADVAYNATNTSTTSDIYYYFGLYRAVASSTDASKSAWIYTGSSGSTTAANSIETLMQVAAEPTPREPNFFELLKASIHQDSLGVTDGFTAAGASTWVGNASTIDGLSDLQILRIGANIIDQATTDNYPTVIAYTPVGTTPFYAYGIKDLPYVSALGFRCVSNWNSSWQDPGGAARQLSDQIVPVLWNPHRTINVTSATSPSQIQLYMTGETGYTLAETINGTVESGSNDYNNEHYNTAPYNQMGLGGFSVASAEQNTGSVIIDQTQLSSFASPNLILSNPGTSIVAPQYSGSYGVLPYHTSGMQGSPGSYTILGLTLANPVYAQGRAPRSGTPSPDLPNSTSWFDGYSTYQGPVNSATGYIHHYMGPGIGGEGLNVILRYKDYQGNWQVYSAMASNEADPNGNINLNYDQFGISDTNGDAIYLPNWNTKQFPTYNSATVNCYATQSNPNNWSASGGILPANSNPANSLASYPYVNSGTDAKKDNRDNNSYFIMKADPRTARFGLSANSGGGYAGQFLNDSIRNPSTLINGNTASSGYTMVTDLPLGTYNVTTHAGTPTDNFTQYYPGMWAVNSLANGSGTYYYDNGPAGQASGVIRPGDDYFNYIHNGLNTPNNVYQAALYAPATSSNEFPAPTLPTSYDARPVVLNRPFRSVGELGYVFRDMAYKSLDMSSSVSVDAALLDFFTVDAAQTPLVAGKVDLNTRQPQVLQCILNGSFRLGDPTTTGGAGTVILGPNAAKAIAGNIVAVTSATAGITTGPSSTGPLQNKAELVTRFGASPNTPNTTSTVFDSNPNSTPFTGTYPATATDTPAASPPGVYPSIKSQREAPVRALADVANTRTWNLMIDVIAQTGQYAPGQTSLSQFIVTGERRYWLHVAIDRFTGKVVDQQLEPVFE